MCLPAAVQVKNKQTHFNPQNRRQTLQEKWNKETYGQMDNGLQNKSVREMQGNLHRKI